MDLLSNAVAEDAREEGRKEGLEEGLETAASIQRETVRSLTEQRFGFVPDELNEVLESSKDLGSFKILVEFTALQAQTLGEIVARAKELLDRRPQEPVPGADLSLDPAARIG